jgi:hypothetical protein
MTPRQLSLLPQRRNPGLVIGCVWGAWRDLKDQCDGLGEQAPSYDWCENVYDAHRRDAPPPGDDLPVWLTALLREEWSRVVR